MYDYVPGKVDWLARNLPTEGAEADDQRVGDLARDDVVTCALDTTVAELRTRIEESPYGFALVASSNGTLLGRVRGSTLSNAPDEATAESVMQPAPSTVRPDLAVDELRDKLDDKELKTALVSTPEGRLIGVVTRKALDQD